MDQTNPQCTREQAIRRAAVALANARATAAQMTPREQAEAAYTPTGPSIDELEDRIRARRGVAPIHRHSDDTASS